MNLTGTLAPNGLMDLWGQAWFVDQVQRLGRTYGAFTSRWFSSIQFPRQSGAKLEPFGHSQDEIQRALADVTISLDAADWFDIEEPIHNVIRADMPPKVRQQYCEMEKEMFLELNGEDIEAPKTLPLNDGMRNLHVIHQASGHKYTRDGFNSRWRKAKEEAKAQYPHLSFDLTFHHLKAKGISNLQGNIYEKQAISGHKNAEQTARYNRKIKVVPVVGGQ